MTAETLKWVCFFLNKIKFLGSHAVVIVVAITENFLIHIDEAKVISAQIKIQFWPFLK